MILADACVWVDHFDRRAPALEEALMRGEVWMHEFVIGELACGPLSPRTEALIMLGAMPRMQLATHAEVLEMLERERLWSRGIGWVDAHLLASALLHRARIMTADRALREAARGLGIAV